MKSLKEIISGSILLSIALTVKANGNEPVYRAVYELNEVYSYIGNGWE